MSKEEYAIILDYLPQGLPTDTRPLHKREPLAYAVGTKYFTLLELVPKKDADIKILDKVYIGPEKRDKILYVKRRVSYNELTSAAKAELPYAIEKIVEENEKRFVDFFNKASPITTRLHQLELLPGIGKKLMWEILEERKKKPFESFKDIEERVKGISDPKKIIAKRILLELEEMEAKSGKGKYKIFVTIPKPSPKRFRRR